MLSSENCVILFAVVSSQYTRVTYDRRQTTSYDNSETCKRPAYPISICAKVDWITWNGQNGQAKRWDILFCENRIVLTWSPLFQLISWTLKVAISLQCPAVVIICRLSVCLSVMQLLLSCSPMPYVFACQVWWQNLKRVPVPRSGGSK